MNKKGQVWVETVTYTLVAFVLIGIVLGFAKPKVDSLRDEAIITQSLDMLKQIDSVITEVQNSGPGNKRKIEISLKKGEIEINPINDTIKFTLVGKHKYSEPDEKFKEGEFNILTRNLGSDYEVSLEKEYKSIHITYSNLEEIKLISQGQTAQKIFITNKGGEKNIINFEVD